MDKEVLQVAIEDIVQPSKGIISTDHLQELTSSVKVSGIRDPLLLRRVANRRYEILSGENRYRAAILCNFTSVPAYIADSRFRTDIKQQQTPVSSFSGQKHKVLDEARKYRDMYYIDHISTRDMAINFGKSEYAIKSRMDMLIMLSPKVQKALDEDLITERHARLLLKINSYDRQDEILDRILKDHITVVELNDIIAREDPMYLTENTEELTPIIPMIGSRNKFINMNLLAQQQQQTEDLYYAIDRIREELGPDSEVTIARADIGNDDYEVRIRCPRYTNKSKVA